MAGNSNSGRPSKPAIHHLISGNASKMSASDLMALVKEEQVATCAPPMPEWLSPEAQDEWQRVVPDLLTLGWIHSLDMAALASYCEAYSDWVRFRHLIVVKNNEMAVSGDVQVFATGAKQISVWRQLANDAEKRMNAAGAAFGFTPVARRSMKAAVPQGELFPNEVKDAADRYFQ